MKIRHSFILVFTVSLFIPIAIPLVNSAWSEAVLGVAGSGVPIILDGGDFSGDGFDDLSNFTPRGGAWRIRGLTAAYFGREGDYPAAGDYNGDGISDIAVFRPESGL